MDVYNKLQNLGKGTFGTVYLCERKHNKLKIVVKEIHGDLNASQLQIAKNEVMILKALNHPNVIRYHDSFSKKSAFYIVMEYARQGNLHELLARCKPHNFLSKERVLSIFTQILSGVDHIHSKKIIHRDLKCENIFLSGANAEVVKIGDFGISKLLNTINNKANTVIGTTNYIAPEICDGQAYDTKSDIWSLGCILYELCALERLFEGSISNVVLAIKSGQRKNISVERYGHDVQQIIDAAIQINPNDRPTAVAFLADPFIFPVRYTTMMDIGNIQGA